MSSVESPVESETRLGRWGVWLAAAAIAAAGCLAYRNTFHAPYELDDHLAIADNPTIRELGRIGRVLRPDTLNMVGRPVLNLSYALDYARGGLDPAAYHHTDLAIHLLAALALLGLARRTLLSPPLRGHFGRDATPLAAAIAGLWALHPLQTEAVTYLTERAESLMGLFYVLSLYAFSRRRYALSWAACALGMGTKEVMVTAPLTILLYDRVFAAGSFRAAWAERKAYYLSLGGTWILLAFLMLQPGWTGRTIGFRAGVSGFDYALTEAWAIARYVRLAGWPHPLVFDYGGPEIVLTRLGEAWPGLLAVAAGLAAAGWAWRRSKPAGFLALSFFLLLSPTSSVVPLVLEPVGEHRMYLPLACLIGLAVAGGYLGLGRKALGAFAAAAALLGAAAFARNADYADPVRLWSGSLRAFPRSARAQVDLGNALSGTPGSGPAAAIPHYRAALRLRPDYAEAHYNLAVALGRTGAPPGQVAAEYREALRLKPGFNEAEFDLANQLAAAPAGLAEAMAHYEAALRRDPGLGEARDNLAVLYARDGRLEEAAGLLRLELQREPGDARAAALLARVSAARRPAPRR